MAADDPVHLRRVVPPDDPVELRERLALERRGRVLLRGRRILVPAVGDGGWASVWRPEVRSILGLDAPGPVLEGARRRFAGDPAIVLVDSAALARAAADSEPFEGAAWVEGTARLRTEDTAAAMTELARHLVAGAPLLWADRRDRGPGGAGPELLRLRGWLGPAWTRLEIELGRRWWWASARRAG